jgi:hypothetical protein
MQNGRVVRRLSTGQMVSLTGPEEKLLRHAFDYLAGFAKRTQLRQAIATKTKAFTAIAAAVPLTKKNIPFDSPQVSIIRLCAARSNNRRIFRVAKLRWRVNRMNTLPQKTS